MRDRLARYGRGGWLLNRLARDRDDLRQQSYLPHFLQIGARFLNLEDFHQFIANPFGGNARQQGVMFFDEREGIMTDFKVKLRRETINTDETKRVFVDYLFTRKSELARC